MHSAQHLHFSMNVYQEILTLQFLPIDYFRDWLMSNSYSKLLWLTLKLPFINQPTFYLFYPSYSVVFLDVFSQDFKSILKLNQKSRIG